MPASRIPTSLSSFLAPHRKDDDNISLRSVPTTVSDVETDSEDDEILTGIRDSRELARYDHTVLDEAEEVDELLVKKKEPGEPLSRIFSRSDNGSHVRIGRIRRKSRQGGRPGHGEGKSRASSSRETRFTTSYTNSNEIGRLQERGHLLHDVKEGNDSHHRRNPSDLSSLGSDDADFEKLVTSSGSRRRSWRIASLYMIGVLVLFCIIFLGAYKQSSVMRSSSSSRTSASIGHNTTAAVKHQRTLLSNGTSLFAPTTIFISLDGFRADFLHLHITPTLSTIIGQGISPAYMLPSFPSVTFPNHFTLMTGLYPESHGVVGNTFYDPHLKDGFYYTDPAKSAQSKWWNADPLWSVAEAQGVRSAVHMWPGSEASIGKVQPSIVDGFNKTELLQRKAQRALDLLDLPGDHDEDIRATNSSRGRRPSFIAIYVPNVDADGHRYGPNSTEVHETIVKVDSMLGQLVAGLDNRNLTDIVNLVIVSDHGMASTSVTRLVQLEDLIDISLIDRLDGWPHRGLRPKEPVEENLRILERQLVDKLPALADRIEVYNKSTMPERYHFSNNDRIAPLWVFPKTGYAVVERPNYDVAKMLKEGLVYHPKGIHGYDHEHPLMRAIFIARGPKFGGVWHENNNKHNLSSLQGGRKIEPFQNIHVYNLIADSLEIEPQANNGTLRLPLRVTDRHEVGQLISSIIAGPSGSVGLTMETLPSSTPNPQSSPELTVKPLLISASTTSSINSTMITTSPTVIPTVAYEEPDGGNEAEDGNIFADLWGGFLEKVDGVKQWAGHIISPEVNAN
ncbi:hypothetical protein KEM54_001461 [Ascosphaera aggregata]|nr:hypothetical protein KEM54_001461 [Ascosphaera aggregata]